MTSDKLKQIIALFGGMLSALYLALKSSGIEVEFLNPDKLNAWENFFTSAVPFIIAIYGVYKNSYLLHDKSKAQEEYLKENNLK